MEVYYQPTILAARVPLLSVVPQRLDRRLNVTTIYKSGNTGW